MGHERVTLENELLENELEQEFQEPATINDVDLDFDYGLLGLHPRVENLSSKSRRVLASNCSAMMHLLELNNLEVMPINTLHFFELMDCA